MNSSKDFDSQLLVAIQSPNSTLPLQEEEMNNDHLLETHVHVKNYINGLSSELVQTPNY